MSHLTEFIHVLAYVKRRLEREEEFTNEFFQGQAPFGGEEVEFPLPGIPSLDQVAEFYLRLNKEVETSQLGPERKRAYRRFTTAAYRAYRAAIENQPQSGTVWHLQECLTYITKALRIAEQSKEHDDMHPVHWSEVYQNECPQDATPPDKLWLLFKLESLLPVLRLSVRVLQLVFPRCPETWHEWEHSLCRKEWLQQFILDSRMSSGRGNPLHAPRRAEVLGLFTLEAL